MTVTADDLNAAIAYVDTTLGVATDADWSVAAGSLEWSCGHTAEHIGDCLLSYAAQLVAQPPGRYVRFLATVEKDASPAELLEFAVMGGRLLVSAVLTSAPDVRAYHPAGMADPEGFAGMGVIEVLLHGQDIAQGLKLPYDPPGDVCARVIARMFPEFAFGGVDPWSALLWCTGRISLPDRPRRETWRWRAVPL